jgi:methylisocitrate lyase
MTPAQRLRQLLGRPGILTVPGVYDCIGAKLIERMGFDVVFTSGFGISGAVLGRPDYGFLTATEMLYSVGRIAQSVGVPVVADIDTGYGNALNVMRTVEDVVRLGIAGVILEDQEWPKKCGHFEGKRVIPAEEQVRKIEAAVRARGDSGLVIIGRTDSLAPFGLEEAIRRGRAYAQAGADVVFIEAPRSVEDLQAIAAAFPDVFLFANMVEGGKTPILSAPDLERLGFKIVVFPLVGLFRATSAMAESFAYLKAHGTTAGLQGILGLGEFQELIGVPHYRAMEERYVTGGK